jgi:diketogulonate reductase-like aldo/keto reductase
MLAVQANGATIPILGLGTWDLRGKVCSRIVEQALRLGYRHVDTAQSYDNEREVGEGIRASGVSREQLFLTTKVWWTNFASGALERSVAESLARLKLPYVDLLLLHWPNAAVPLKESFDALHKVKSEGLTRHIGISNFTVALVEEAISVASDPIVNNQIEMHPFIDQRKVIAACSKRGISVTAYSPIARGAVTKNDTINKIGKAYGKTAAQVSLRYLVQQGVIAIPATTRVERLSENFDIFDFELSDAEMNTIRALGSRDGRTINPSWSPTWD